jgi:molybdopterin converting factor subunit 1
VNVTVLFFAQARDRAKCASQTIDVPAGSRVSDVLAQVKREHPELEPLWPHLAVALDGKLVTSDAAVSDRAELALLPPVSGG